MFKAGPTMHFPRQMALRPSGPFSKTIALRICTAELTRWKSSFFSTFLQLWLWEMDVKAMRWIKGKIIFFVEWSNVKSLLLDAHIKFRPGAADFSVRISWRHFLKLCVARVAAIILPPKANKSEGICRHHPEQNMVAKTQTLALAISLMLANVSAQSGSYFAILSYAHYWKKSSF